MTSKDSVPATKKAKISYIGGPSSVSSTEPTGMEIVVAGQPPQQAGGDATNQVTSLIPRAFERLSLTINPDYIQKLTSDGCLGFERLPAQRMPTMRYYVIDLDVFKVAISNLMTSYLTLKHREQGKLSAAQITAEVTVQTPIIVDACVSALYSKLRTIHKSFGTYATRFNSPATYNRDIELPLPLADAIQNFGVFNPLGTLSHYLCVPVYPEGVQNEGRNTQAWNSYSYESYLPILKSLGIPFKSVDTRIKSGSPWWSYRISLVEGHFDLRCIFPPSNYSDHSAISASMFIVANADGTEALPLIEFKDDDGHYPVRFREVAPGFQLRAFSALCHAPSEEWNQYLLID